MNLLQPSEFTLSLSAQANVPWPSSSDPNRLAGTNLYPSFTLYRGWDTDAGIKLATNGVTIDQDHTFNNRGNIDWAEDITYLDHLENSAEHAVSRTWNLPAGQYTINLGGNSPSTLAEGRQGYRARFITTPATRLTLRSTASGIVLSWPANLLNYKVYQSTEIGGTWSTLSGEPSVADGMYTYTIPISGPVRFFQLRR